MAQTTDSLPVACGYVELSTSGVSWVDISGTTQTVLAVPMQRKSGEAYTLAGDTALISAGKREPIAYTFTIIYTEEDTDAYQVARILFEIDCGEDFYVRYWPAGKAVGNECISTGAVELINWEYPPMNAGEGGVTLCSCRFLSRATSTAVTDYWTVEVSLVGGPDIIRGST